MKNAMKKIMGLLLVAVLLVSVVPFQALAAEVVKGGTAYKGFQSITISVNNGESVNSAWVENGGTGPETKTIKDILNRDFPKWSNGDYGFQSATYQDTTYTDADTILHTNFDDTSVVIKLYATPRFTVNVNYCVDGTSTSRGSHDFTGIKQGASLSFSDIAANNPEPTAYKVDRVVYNNGANSFSSGSITVNDNMWLTAYLKGIGGGNSDPETSKLNVQYIVNGVTTSAAYDVEHKTVSELVDMGGYTASNFNISAKVGSTSKGMGDVIERGETVVITMNTKSTDTKLLNVQYIVNGTTRNAAYDVDGKTVSELVSDSKLGGYTASNYNITAKVGSTNKGMNDVIYRGETVVITMTSKNTTTPTQVLTAHYYIDGDYDKTKEYNVDGKTVSELVSLGGYTASNYSKITATVDGTDKTTSDVISRGQSVKVYLSSKSTNKFPYKVYLHVYLNNNIGEPDRNINITNTLATDGVVSMSEVKNLIPTYYSAKNSNGITYDGLYLAKGNWVKDYVTDSSKMEKLTDVDVRTGEEYVHINVMITNAKAKSTSTADSSNPKTGDAIFMTITVMGLSAAALTGMYFYDKKRKAL